ncbi:MAG TPA: class II fumarate hydratase [Candidatus Eisenbacteria bacterium]|jgi:fumarate hydratase class II|nr:class II fumarate hydratase [Candidatus Eisenbacteria bacterium]
MSETRVEKDSMGEVRVPAAAYFGAQTQRAVDNFPVSGRPMPPAFVHALGHIKAAAARVNQGLGTVDGPRAQLIERAAGEVAKGTLDAHFPIDVFQTGSGTSSNMNANEVIARRAAELGGAGAPKIHPNDHVNFGQSSNDIAPSAVHVAAVLEIERDLLPALERLRAALTEKARAFDGVIKSGRTHLMDATPIRLGQEFSGYASQIDHGIERVKATLPDLRELAAGGTAVGTGLNTHPEFGRRLAEDLSRTLGTPFVEARNHFEAQGARDAALWASSALNSVAASLVKIANDIRLMGSGPHTGLAELQLPALQPGSSIMPGKVNPVICEAVIQVGAQVAGNQVAITIGVQGGQLDLNTMVPVIARNLLESVALLAAVSRLFADKCIAGLEANAEQCRDYVERSPSMATALNPLIGYDKAAEIAKRSAKERRPVRELAKEMTSLSAEEIDRALDPRRQTEPGLELGGGSGA